MFILVIADHWSGLLSNQGFYGPPRVTDLEIIELQQLDSFCWILLSKQAQPSYQQLDTYHLLSSLRRWGDPLPSFPTCSGSKKGLADGPRVTSSPGVNPSGFAWHRARRASSHCGSRDDPDRSQIPGEPSLGASEPGQPGRKELLKWAMKSLSTPDFAKPWFMTRGVFPQKRHDEWYLFYGTFQILHSRLGFINAGLTCCKPFMISNWQTPYPIMTSSWNLICGQFFRMGPSFFSIAKLVPIASITWVYGKCMECSYTWGCRCFANFDLFCLRQNCGVYHCN